MRVIIKRKTHNLDKLTQKLKALKNKKVESGYFPGQGVHSESGETYASLMNLHEYGFMGEDGYVPSRPVRGITSVYVKSTAGKWAKPLSNYLFHNSPLPTFLGGIGEDVTSYARSLFGVSGVLQPTSNITQMQKGGQDTPLVDTGSLRAHWTWKISQR